MIAVADAISLPLPDKSVDLVFGSPPYMDARTYGINAQRDCVEWVDWMFDVTREALRVARNCVVWVVGGVTRDRNYWPGPEGLLWEWYKRGGDCHLMQPCYFYRIGIPGGGGEQGFRRDAEYILIFKRPGKLPWSDNTACGHPPKWAPGGMPSHRMRSGRRVNRIINPGGERGHKGERQGYTAPTLANPGNVLCEIDGECVLPPALAGRVGGGHMGHPIAHKGEAPFPEWLAEFVILSLCPPGGVVCDPFVGTGTTAVVTQRHGRRFVALDIRPSECDKTRQRLTMNQLALL